MSEESISKEVTQNNTMGSSSPDVKTESDLLCTPKRLIHPRLDFLAGECRSPALQIPASPMMQRLGYGTGKLWWGAVVANVVSVGFQQFSVNFVPYVQQVSASF